jgi:predicted N-formylglutamate amidohydrolase
VSRRAPSLLLTCEHGGNRVPAALRARFRGAQEVLESHRGYDHGALELARYLRRRLRAPLVANQVTRLVADLNRSSHHPYVVSEFTRDLPRAALLDAHWRPHREAVAEALASFSGPVLHVAVHSFHPIVEGSERHTDLAVLYDPGRPRELALAKRWAEALRSRFPDLVVRRNYPFRGVADGLPTALRKVHPDRAYAGFEFEVNKRVVWGDPSRWRDVKAGLAQTLAELLSG